MNLYGPAPIIRSAVTSREGAYGADLTFAYRVPYQTRFIVDWMTVHIQANFNTAARVLMAVNKNGSTMIPLPTQLDIDAEIRALVSFTNRTGTLIPVSFDFRQNDNVIVRIYTNVGASYAGSLTSVTLFGRQEPIPGAAAGEADPDLVRPAS